MAKITTKKLVLIALFIGVLVGAVGFGGTVYVMHETSSTEFCVSCHTMEQPFQEYKASQHYSNARGIRAECSDCHIPQQPLDYLITKIRASKDVYHEFVTGKIDTPEKYESHRLAMAEAVWETFRENDSATCRSCHTRDAMDPYEQPEETVAIHNYGIENNQTCIDCHKGVAHFAPEMKLDDKAFDELLANTKNTKKEATVVYPAKTISMGDLGTISPATKLHVISADGDNRTVRIDGYQLQGAEQVLYVAEGKRAIIAMLTEKGLSSLELGEYEADAYGNHWRSASLTAQITEPVLESLQPLWAYAEDLDTVYCSTCHAKIAPEHFTVNAWAPVAKSMGDRTDISELNLEILTKFLQSNAKDSASSAH